MAPSERESHYDPACRRCPRLAGFLDAVAEKHPGYFCKPVPPFGDERPRLLVVGLAPGLHGANRTGRPFTGDACSDLLYGSLFRAGIASAARSISSDDGLVLKGCRITNAVKCLPPDNKPTGSEVKACGGYLSAELQSLKPKVVLCLGAVAHDAVLRCLNLGAYGLKAAAFKFAHGACHQIACEGDSLVLVDSYHPSRYNVNTGRLTEPMFDAAVTEAARLSGLSHV